MQLNAIYTNYLKDKSLFVGQVFLESNDESLFKAACRWIWRKYKFCSHRIKSFNWSGSVRKLCRRKYDYVSGQTSYPLFPELKKIVSKITGIDQIIEEVIQRLGSLHSAYLIGDYAKGIDSGTNEVILVCEKVDEVYLQELTSKAE